MLRRPKSIARQAAVLMAQNLESAEDASAWMVVFACKSVFQILHTSAAPLIASLIDCHLTSDTANLSYTLLRRVLTALIHHCNSSEQFSVVASLVVDRFCTLSQAEDVNHQQL
ncbi:hypothetical protein M405DRAFT_922040 [Rhizopogon salebrosus TDB-379]|nr:hypothetical protein M405DRAFT_922040 [Rhizopogon salebrosus TDB-379]